MTEPDDAAWIAAAGAPRAGISAADDDGDLDEVSTAAPTDPAPTDPAQIDSEANEPEPTDPEPPDHRPIDPEPTAAPPYLDEAAPATDGHPEPTVDPSDTAAPRPSAVELGPTGRPRRLVPEPPPVVGHGPARVLAMCNQKGGVGKTTSTINLGAALAGYGRKVLLVDLDPQGALSAGLGVASHELDRTVYNLMLEHSTQITDVLVPTKVPGMDLIPANIDLSAAEVQLITEVGREQILSRALRPVLAHYDYVLIDCQPSLGLLTVNALAVANGVIIPLAAEFFSLRGVALLVDTIDKVKQRINPELDVEGVLVTMFDGRTVHGREVVNMLVQRFGDDVYDTVIARTVKFPETTVAGEPITSYAPASQAAEAYRALAREVIAR
jgi:chromosome partitioning protein